MTLSRSDLRLARRIQPQNVDSRDRERWWCCAGGDISCSPIRNSRYPRLRLAVPRLITVLYIGIALPLRRQFHAEIHCEIIRRRGGEGGREGERCGKWWRMRNRTSRDNLIFSNFIRCASIKIQPPCRANTVTPLVPPHPSHAAPRYTCTTFPRFSSIISFALPRFYPL